MNNTSKRYPVEVRERAVRMVLEHEGEYDSQWAAISSVASKLGMTPETLRKWVRRAEIDGGLRSGVYDRGASAHQGTRAGEPRAPARERDPQGSRGFLRSGARPQTEEMTAFIAERKEEFGVEPMCDVLPIAPSTYYAAITRPPSARKLRDEALKPEITRVYEDN